MCPLKYITVYPNLIVSNWILKYITVYPNLIVSNWILKYITVYLNLIVSNWMEDSIRQQSQDLIINKNNNENPADAMLWSLMVFY